MRLFSVKWALKLNFWTVFEANNLEPSTIFCKEANFIAMIFAIIDDEISEFVSKFVNKFVGFFLELWGGKHRCNPLFLYTNRPIKQ